MGQIDGLEIKRALKSVNASQTDSELVAAVTDRKIRVLAVTMSAGATKTGSTFNTKGTEAGTAISCLYSNPADVPVVLPFNPAGWFETTAGEALTVTTGGGSATGYQVVYVVD